MNIEEIKSFAVPILWDNMNFNDTLLECRSIWTEKFQFLQDKIFDELVENYIGENPDDELKAFGQELTTFGYNLYNIADEDDENLLLTIIEEKDTKEFEKLCKKQGSLCKLFKQQGKKQGENAGRVDPKAKMPCETHRLPADHNIRAVAGDFAFGRTPGESGKGFVIDLTGNLDNIVYFKEPILSCAYSESIGLYTVLTSKQPKGYKLMLGKNPKEIEKWQEIEVPNGIQSLVTDMYWFNDKLYFGFGKKVFEVSKTKSNLIKSFFSKDSDKYECKALWYEEENSGYMYFTETENKSIYLSGSISHYRDLFVIKNGELKKLDYSRAKNSFLKGVSNGEDSVYYCQMSVGNRNNFISIMIDVDFATRKYRFRELKNMDEWAYLTNFDKNWIAIKTSSDGISSKNKDLMQLWNPITDEFLSLKVGSFGKDNLAFIQILSNKEIAIITASAGSGYQIRKPKNFWQFMEESNKKKLKPNDWQVSDELFPGVN